jgi:hypothetical protein
MASIENLTIGQAIEASIGENRTVKLALDDINQIALNAECDGCVDSNGDGEVDDYWGGEGAQQWRVRLVRER